MANQEEISELQEELRAQRQEIEELTKRIQRLEEWVDDEPWRRKVAIEGEAKWQTHRKQFVVLVLRWRRHIALPTMIKMCAEAKLGSPTTSEPNEFTELKQQLCNGKASTWQIQWRAVEEVFQNLETHPPGGLKEPGKWHEYDPSRARDKKWCPPWFQQAVDGLFKFECRPRIYSPEVDLSSLNTSEMIWFYRRLVRDHLEVSDDSADFPDEAITTYELDTDLHQVASENLEFGPDRVNFTREQCTMIGKFSRLVQAELQQSVTSERKSTSDVSRQTHQQQTKHLSPA